MNVKTRRSRHAETDAEEEEIIPRTLAEAMRRRAATVNFIHRMKFPKASSGAPERKQGAREMNRRLKQMAREEEPMVKSDA